jgi:hypothetical protein
VTNHVLGVAEARVTGHLLRERMAQQARIDAARCPSNSRRKSSSPPVSLGSAIQRTYPHSRRESGLQTDDFSAREPLARPRLWIDRARNLTALPEVPKRFRQSVAHTAP